MPKLHEVIETRLSPADTFAFIAEFANAEIWDPGTLESKRIDTGPLGVGARYAVTVKVGENSAPMTYMIDVYEPDTRVVLVGKGELVTARDDIRFEPMADGGTRVDYTADLTLNGWRQLATPFLSGAFRTLGDNARIGMTAALAERVRSVRVAVSASAAASAGRTGATAPAGQATSTDGSSPTGS